MGHLKQITIPEKSPRKIGVVESDTRSKTRTVAISFSYRHPKYGKHLHRTAVIHVHDENNESKVGDRVEIAECRPISRTKSWVLLRILRKAGERAVHTTTMD